jgi:hypothetical protein
VAEDIFDGLLVGDESGDLRLGAASGTGQRVHFVDAVDELPPFLGESSRWRAEVDRLGDWVMVAKG